MYEKDVCEEVFNLLECRAKKEEFKCPNECYCSQCNAQRGEGEIQSEKKMKPTNVREIVKQWLEQSEYDGLLSLDGCCNCTMSAGKEREGTFMCNVLGCRNNCNPGHTHADGKVRLEKPESAEEKELRKAFQLIIDRCGKEHPIHVDVLEGLLKIFGLEQKDS